MAEYIERTEELVLAMNAGARAIENTRRYHGAVYSKNVFSETPQKIPYLLAAKVLREVSDAPTVDAVVVTRCKDCKHFKDYGKTSLRIDGKNIKAGWCHRRARYDEEYRMPPDGFCSYGERKDGGDG